MSNMYPVPRQAHQYPSAAPQQLRHEDAGLPIPPHHPGSISMNHPLAHQQHQLPPQHQLQQHQQIPAVQQQQQQQHHLQQQQHQMQQQVQHQNATFAPPADPRADYVGTHNNRTYRLRVEQQPIRARMCGFGDKDRRPITPPPCIRLVVCDARTGKEIDFNEVDSSFFVLMVDLWHEDASRAVNLVRHSSAAPTVSISSSTIVSYPPTPERPMYVPAPVAPVWDPGRPGVAVNQYGQQYYAPQSSPAAYQFGTPNGGGYPPSAAMAMTPAPPPSVNQNHTRNLIGQNAVNACRLQDPDGKTGFWFVLQDLSVRTEGTFRLKLSICDVGAGNGSNAVVSQGKCAVLATSFSDPFMVYSAKKFPGVIESTPLSKCFAGQGIKIPIRKDGPKQMANQEEYDADD